MILAIENCFKIFTFYKSNFSSINFEIFSNFERTLLQLKNGRHDTQHNNSQYNKLSIFYDVMPRVIFYCYTQCCYTEFRIFHCYAECHFAECLCAQCHIFVAMLNAVMLNVALVLLCWVSFWWVLLCSVLFCWISFTLSVVMVSAVVLSVVAPMKWE